MPQSLASLPIHLSFSTKGRAATLDDSVRDEFHRYASAVMQNLKCQVVLVNSVDDHVHILFELARTASVSEVVEKVKTATSRWLKTQGNVYSGFAWQSGYGAFAVSKSAVHEVAAYIAGQKEHHGRRSFQEEYRAFLEQHGIEYDERYVWD